MAKPNINEEQGNHAKKENLFLPFSLVCGISGFTFLFPCSFFHTFGIHPGYLFTNIMCVTSFDKTTPLL